MQRSIGVHLYKSLWSGVGVCRLGRSRWLLSLLWVMIVVVGNGQAVERPTASPASKVTRVGNLSITIPDGWKRSDSGAADEGYWQLGAADAPEACFTVIRDQAFEQFGGTVEVEQEKKGKLAGLSGRRIEGTLETATGPSRTIVWELKTKNGGVVALVCTAQKDSWKRLEPALTKMLESVRLVEAGPIKPSPTTPNTSPLPSRSSSTPPNSSPKNPPNTNPTPGTRAVPPVVTPPANTSHSRPAYPPAGMRCYVHGRGDYRFLYPATWTLQKKSSLGVADIDFDTLVDPTGRYNIVCSRVREPLADVATGLARWHARKKQYFPRAFVSKEQVAGRPGLRVAHVDRKTGKTVFRQSFVAQGSRYAITVYAPRGTGLNTMPAEATKILSSIQFLRDAAALARWKVVQAGPFQLRIPPGWRAGATEPSRGLLASFESGVEARFTLEKSKDRRGFVSMHRPRLITENLWVGGRAATAYLGSLPNNGGTRMAVVLDRPEPDGGSYCLACYAVAGKWAKYESTFRTILATARCNTPPDRAVGKKPQPIELLKKFPRTHTFQGDTDYSVAAYANAVVIRDRRTGRTQTVWMDANPHQAYTVFKNALRKHPDVARRLGPALSRCVPVFEDRIRVQLFDSGVVIGETSTRAVWWGTHRTRKF